MTEAQRVSFSEVKQEFLKQYPYNNWQKEVSLWCLNWTEKHVGNWYKVRLSRDDVLSILMPGHAHSKYILIPKKGALLKSVYKRAKKLEYKSKNPKCVKTIEHFKHSEFSPIFLSTRFKAMGHYKGHVKIKTALYHVDGLHRLIAWGLDGRYTNQYLETHPMCAYVAKGKWYKFLHWPSEI